MNVARILVIEDEPKLALAIQQGLQDELHAVDVERNGTEGLAAAETDAYELILLDLMLPGLPGLQICKRLRAAGRAVPILMLTARDTTESIVEGLDAGADDYLTKPFKFGELLARVRAMLRRTAAAVAAKVRVGPLELDAVGHRVWRDGEELTLTAKEFQLLELLVRRRGSILSKARLMEAVWERDMEPESNSIEVHMANLRRKVDRNREPALIHTVRGIGYVVRVEAD